MKSVARNNEVPVIPYRKLEEKESKALREYARSLNSKYENIFWQQTIPEARRITEIVRAQGFVIGDAEVWGEEIVHRNPIYPKNYSNSPRVPISCYYNQVIGSVDLWKFGGFNLSPVKVFYKNPSRLEDSLELRKFFVENGIPFCDSVNMGELDSEIIRLPRELTNKNKTWRVLESIKDLRLD